MFVILGIQPFMISAKQEPEIRLHITSSPMPHWVFNRGSSQWVYHFDCWEVSILSASQKLRAGTVFFLSFLQPFDNNSYSLILQFYLSSPPPSKSLKPYIYRYILSRSIITLGIFKVNIVHFCTSHSLARTSFAWNVSDTGMYFLGGKVKQHSKYLKGYYFL